VAGPEDSAMMKRLDLSLSQDRGPGLLTGLSFAVKDMFDILGETAAFGCPDWLAGQNPATQTAPSVQTMLEAGARLKANAICDELAFSLDGINVHYGTPVNPQDPERIPGGSSSGPASLVAGGYVDFALGTDTAGSVRVPASYCGIFGLRPTHGAISLAGVRPLGPTFDTVGIFSRALPVMQKIASAYFTKSPGQKAKKLVVMSDAMDLLAVELQPYMMAALARVQSAFSKVETRPAVGTSLEELVKNFAAIRGREAWELYGPWLEEKKPALGTATEARLRACRQASKIDCAQATLLRDGLRLQFFDSDEIFVLPTTAALAPLLSSTQDELDNNRALNLKLCALASFVGLPQLTIPLSALLPGQTLPKTMPGLSIIGPINGESSLLTLASHLTA
jgi:amidase